MTINSNLFHKIIQTAKKSHYYYFYHDDYDNEIMAKPYFRWLDVFMILFNYDFSKNASVNVDKNK